MREMLKLLPEVLGGGPAPACALTLAGAELSASCPDQLARWCSWYLVAPFLCTMPCTACAHRRLACRACPVGKHRGLLRWMQDQVGAR